MKREPSAVDGTRQVGTAGYQRRPNAWFAVTVKPNHEQTAARALTAKGPGGFLPPYRARRRGTGRVRRPDLPWFGGQVFCRFERSGKARVPGTPAVTSVAGFGHQPAAIPGFEIEPLRTLAARGCYAGG